MGFRGFQGQHKQGKNRRDILNNPYNVFILTNILKSPLAFYIIRKLNLIYERELNKTRISCCQHL